MKLAQLIVQYVAFRKNLGQDFESNRKRLRAFSRFVGESVATDSVKPPQVAAFLAGRGPITSYWHLKYGTLRGFFNYAITRGYLSTSPLPATVPKPPARFVPHIYSREELRRLLDSTASYQKHKTRIVMEPHTFRAMLRRAQPGVSARRGSKFTTASGLRPARTGSSTSSLKERSAIGIHL